MLIMITMIVKNEELTFHHLEFQAGLKEKGNIA